MKYRLFFILILTTLFVISSISGIGINNKKIFSNSIQDNNYDAEIPIWDIGDSWIYEIDIDGEIGDLLDLNNIRITNLEFIVDEIQDEYYQMSVEGDISGSVSINLDLVQVSGNLQNTNIIGTILVNKSTIFIEKIIEMDITGTIKPIIGQVQFSATIDGNISYEGEKPVKLPLNIGDSWLVDFTLFEFNYEADILGQNPNGEMGIYIEPHNNECDSWDEITLNNNFYDSLKISNGLAQNANIWYSPKAGNIVKYSGYNIPFITWLGNGIIDIDIKLIDTTYQPPGSSPEIPATPNGENSVTSGDEEDYTTFSNDPDQDKIKYIFDWGDGTTSFSDFIKSGETASVSKKWTQKGSFYVKVKARDIYGYESEWSDTITVVVENEKPLKPVPPDGPGKIKRRKAQTFTAVTTDPNGHDIKYMFDWGDGSTTTSEYQQSGIEVSETHIWYSKGSYQIKVKAIDEYGEESDWSDPTPIQVSTTTNNIFEKPQSGHIYSKNTGESGLPFFLLGDMIIFLQRDIVVTITNNEADRVEYMLFNNLGDLVEEVNINNFDDVFTYNFGKPGIGIYSIDAYVYNDDKLIESGSISKILSIAI